MNFFDIGMLEIVLILTVAILIFGPGRIPEIARQMGKGMRAFRKITGDLTKEFTRALDAEEKQASSKPAAGGGKSESLGDVAKKAVTDKAGKSLDKFLGGSGEGKG
jgi:sec-independent protein translocase protein TatA